jgi:hypothetical protein
VGILLGACGVVSLSRSNRQWCAALLIIFGAVAFFFINYRVVDKDTMFLPAYVCWAIFVAEGIRAVWGLVAQWAARACVPSLLAPTARSALLALAPLGLVLNWAWVDMSADTSPSIFADHVLRTAGPDAMILASWSPAVVLEYYQIVDGERPDLIIVNRSRSSVATYYQHWVRGESPPQILDLIARQEHQLVDREVRERPVYTVEYDRLFADAYEYTPMGDYFQLNPR